VTAVKNPQNPREQALAFAVLIAAAGKASAALDRFSTWLLAGYAATVALLVSRPVGSRPELPGETMKDFLLMFLMVAGLGVVAKFLSIVIVSASEAAAVGREYGLHAVKESGPINIEAFVAEYLRVLPRPMLWVVRPSMKRLLQGDLLQGAKFFLSAAQVQALFIALQVAVIFWTIYVVANTATF
jgi:hypothetical protein